MVSRLSKLVKLRLLYILNIVLHVTSHSTSRAATACMNLHKWFWCVTRLRLFPVMQVCTERWIQLAEQDNLQLFPLPMDSVGCPCDCRSGILHSGLFSGSQESLLPKGMSPEYRAAHYSSCKRCQRCCNHRGNLQCLKFCSEARQAGFPSIMAVC